MPKMEILKFVSISSLLPDCPVLITLGLYLLNRFEKMVTSSTTIDSTRTSNEVIMGHFFLAKPVAQTR